MLRQRMARVLVGVAVVSAVAIPATLTTASAAVRIDVHQVGSAGDDRAYGIATDASGNEFIAGWTTASMPTAAANAGDHDVFVSKYSSTGVRQWVRQLGTTGDDRAYGAAVDGSGHVAVVGFSTGTLPGAPVANAGVADAFVASYDTSGTVRWVREFGTAGDDRAEGVTADASGNVYVTGYSGGVLPGSSDLNKGAADAFVTKYDTSGNRVWVREIGTSVDDVGYGIALNSCGDIYVSGRTRGSLAAPGATAGGMDAFLAKFSASGSTTWVRQVGSAALDASRMSSSSVSARTV